jgi:hypothetical protein
MPSQRCGRMSLLTDRSPAVQRRNGDFVMNLHYFSVVFRKEIENFRREHRYATQCPHNWRDGFTYTHHTGEDMQIDARCLRCHVTRGEWNRYLHIKRTLAPICSANFAKSESVPLP